MNRPTPLRDGGVRSTILVVEDNESVLEALVDTLRLFGYIVYYAPNGNDALALARGLDRAVDLIISDYMMPGMNALKLHQALKSISREADMLVLTGYPLPFSQMELDENREIRWARNIGSFQ